MLSVPHFKHVGQVDYKMLKLEGFFSSGGFGTSWLCVLSPANCVFVVLLPLLFVSTLGVVSGIL